MTMTLKTSVTLAFAALLLSGCTSMNIFKDSNEAPPAADVAPLEPEPLQPMNKGMSAAQISKALAGKSWKWAGPNNSGVTLFANDGSSLVEVTGKGTTTGKWMAKNGQLCERFEPAPFLPKGVPMTCQPISGGGNTYRVGQATFTLAL
jgi:PBP1b-binding outer membrane lipoprotein LpoB